MADPVVLTDPVEQDLGGLVRRLAVKTRPLSVKIDPGMPWRVRPSSNASHTGLAVARTTRRAITQNLEWSSIPVTAESWVPSLR